TIYDGEQLFRRFDAKGQQHFTAELDAVQAPTRHLVAVVTDVNGRQAVSREIWMEQQMDLYNYCGDRVNAPGSIFQPIHGHPYYDPKTGIREAREYFVDLTSPDLYIERYRTDWVYNFKEISDEFGWHNWAPHHLRDDYTFMQRAYGWYQAHGRKIAYDLHPSQAVSWDGFTEAPKDYGKQLAPGKIDVMDNELTLKKSATLDADGFLTQSVKTWEQAISKEAPGVYTIVLADRKVITGTLADLKAPLLQPLSSGSIVSAGPAPGVIGQSTLLTGDHLACLITVNKDKATVKVGVLAKEHNTAGQRFTWHTETVNRQATAEQLLAPKWFTIAQGKLLDMPLSELHAAVDTAEGTATIKLTRPAFDTNCQPLIIAGVNPNWTTGNFEKPTGLFRPIGVFDGKAYCQLPGTKANVTVVIGNIVRADKPEIRIEAFQETNESGKPTGKFIVDANNPTTTDLTVTFTVPKAFDLVKTHQAVKTIPAGTSVRVEM
ncbi:MAG TPA: hypothetical protein VGM23_10560, partial [Armatimonadota bacterium]